ncbi:SIR2 family NAD-dependent protein deacylase [Adhaeribacter rhizoryzae]|uniref:NAD-dependent protein deacylase n=1 Tax=Adhaeribacter rhizoryzae TaxID=2607907 RepID=A0A5M6CY81_9BACT|nr:NAD-dependent deacylase [Adhaeribacter rhizoryzae]KAA5539380.1 NAD-dependent deacylase [Adhaeribacter rhizoryzae]
MQRKKLVVLTGAGISAESGIATFRDANGLWEGHDVMEVASPEGWRNNQALVLDFYNQRRKQAAQAKPNPGHLALAELEKKFAVTIITQNVDHLHEQAGSTKVIHLHGSLFQSRSTADESLVYPIEGWELKLGDKCERGSQLRPNIVWFGEMVPLMDLAITEAQQADIFMVVGTSLVVYPAAGLVHYVPAKATIYVIDPNLPPMSKRPNLHLIPVKSGEALPQLAQKLMEEAI